MKTSKRKVNTVSIIPERKHGRPAGIRLITRSTTVRPFVYSLHASESSQEATSYSKRSRKNEDQSMTKNPDNSADSFYFSNPVKNVSSRKKRNIKYSLLKSFNALPATPQKDALETGDAQNKNSLHASSANLLQKVFTATENLTIPIKTTTPLEMPSNTSAIPQSEFYSFKIHKEAVVAKRKNNHSASTETSYVAKQKESAVIYQSQSFTYSSGEKSKKKEENRHLADISHEALQEISMNGEALAGTEAQSVGSLEAKKNLDDPAIQPSVHLFSEHNFQEQKSDRGDICKSNSMQEITAVNMSIKESSIPSRKAPLISKTSTPVKLKSNEANNTSSLQISSIFSSRISSTRDEENRSLIESRPINKECDIYINHRIKNADICEENMSNASHKTFQCIKLKKCTIVLENLPVSLNLKHLTKEKQEGTSIKENEKENGETSNSRERKTKHVALDENADRNKTQKKDITEGEHIINGNKNAEQGEMIAISETSPKTSISNTDGITSNSNKSNKDTEHESLLVSPMIFSKNPEVHSSLENITSQAKVHPDNMQSDNSQIGMSDSLAELLSGKRKKSCKSSSSTRRSASKTNEHPRNALLDADNKEPAAFAQKEPLVFQEKELQHPSNKHFTYTAVMSNIRTALSKQPRKSRHKTKPDSGMNQISDRHPLFKEQKKVKLWNGKMKRRRISDISDLDIALNVIDEVIGEIREEVENKQELFYQIQEKYQDSLLKMISKVQDVKRRDKQVKELMATVKDLVDELDKIVDEKIRLQSMFLELKAKKTTKANDPTWENFSKF